MGFYMTTWLKLTLLAFTISSLVSCIKEPLQEEENPATVAEVQSALSEGWGSADPLSMTPNDFLFQETEQTLENNPNPFFVLQEGITVSKKEETATEYLYSFLYQSKVYKQGEEGKESTREDHRSVTKADPAVAMAKNLRANELKTLADDYQMTLGYERLYGLAYACLKSDALDKYCKEQLKVDSCEIQCSNLKVSDVIRPAPDLMKTQPDCGGLTDCSLRTKTVNFDWTLALKSGESVEKQKVNYSVSFSPDLPFLSRMTEYCFRQLYPVQNQKVLVTTCTKLKNFKRGG